MEKLNLGNTVILDNVKYRVDTSGSGYYLQNSSGSGNATFFENRDLNKTEVQNRALGYSKSGGFPFCKTLEDLTKFVEYLQNMYSPSGPISTTTLKADYQIDLSPDKIKKEGRLNTFLLLNQ